jgi:RimJ/RimL family protein N-acetyltransferase
LNILTTERLILRELVFSDASFIIELLNDPGYIKHIANKNVNNLEQAKNYIENTFIKSYLENGFGLYLVEKNDKTPIGICGLVKRDIIEDVDIGYAFLEKHCKKGYALEASKAVMNYAKNTLSLSRIVGITTRENSSSIALLTKLGLNYKKDIKFNSKETLMLFVPA